tara:strand:+ start:492 stop:722 length:231 start_codon:yes stop_codon:yes gene_type:complete
MTKNSKNPDEVYQGLLIQVLEFLEHDYPFEMVAASLMAIAQRLYRTNLNDKDYRRIMKVAYETHVEPYDFKKETIH